jgi:hypothetical protein
MILWPSRCWALSTITLTAGSLVSFESDNFNTWLRLWSAVLKRDSHTDSRQLPTRFILTAASLLSSRISIP